ncbi:MAG: hypothetical protein J6A63_09445 [Clostridia bacterium]|nr:hypothetical protein [Clostridia bacterium]
MKGIVFIKKIWMKLAAVFALTLLLSFPAFVTPVTAETAHNCYYVGSMSASQGIGQTEVDALIANRETPENMGLTPSEEPYTFFLTEDIAWEGEFVAPEGIVMAICLNGHTVNGTCINEGTTGGIYYFQCAQHNCLERNTTAPLVDQVYFDLMLKVFEKQASLNAEEGATEETAVEIDVDMFLALGADVTVGEEWVLSSSSNLTVCTNGYTLTGVEYMTAHGGTVTLIDCSLLHDCYYFGSSAMGIGQKDVDGLIAAGRTPEAWGMSASDEPYAVYLYEDISWEGTLSAPDGVYIALCVNGHTVTGDIDNSKTVDGGIYLMQCGLHDCQIMGDSLMVLSPGYVSLMEEIMAKQGGEIEFGSGAAMALGGDITLTNQALWGIDASNSITFCTCGYTINNLEYMTANGATVRLIDCSNIGPHACEELDGETAEFLTKTNYSQWLDVNSGMIKEKGDYTFCLLGDVKLDKTIIIPEGCTVKLCLNGFTITSPQIIWGTTDIVNGTENNVCCTAIQVMKGASLTVCDCSANQTGKIAVDMDNMQGLGALLASAVQNLGSFTLKSGQLVGMAPLLNGGEATMDGGTIVGVLAGVAQAEEVFEGMQGLENPTFTMNGGEVHSAALGVIGQSGDITVNDGEISAVMVGVGSNFDAGDAAPGADIYLNGGTINAGALDSETYKQAGLPLEDEDDSGISSEQCIGVATGSALVLGDDVTINVEGPGADGADYTADILLGDGATMTKAEGTTLENTYEVAVKEAGTSATVDPSIAGNVVPATVSNATIGENGELTVIPNDEGFTATAQVAGYTLSLKGDIMVNFYVTMEEAFLNNPDARVVIVYKGERMEYTANDAVKNGSMYVFSLAVSAKDYQKNISCSFTDGTNVWAGMSVTVNKYLNGIINDTTGTYDKAKDVAEKMQNYCMAASYHFGIASTYAPTAAMATLVEGVTAEDLTAYAEKQEGASENINYAGVTLFLQSTTTIRFYLTLNSGKNINDAKITVNGNAVTPKKSGSYYYIEITNVTAQNLGYMYKVDLDGIKLEYSALSYAHGILSRGGFGQSTVDAVKSLYLYHKAAYAYFNPTTEEVE